MGFNYATIAGTKAHAHSNAVGDGGGLNNTTVLNNTTLFGLILMGSGAST